MKKNRTIIGRIINVVQLLGKLNLPFRGRHEGECSMNKGGFKEFIAHMAKSNPLIENHLHDCAGTCTYNINLSEHVHLRHAGTLLVSFSSIR